MSLNLFSFQCSDVTSKRIARKIFHISLLLPFFIVFDYHYLIACTNFIFHQGMAPMRENVQKLFCQVWSLFHISIISIAMVANTIIMIFCIESYESTMPPPNPVNESQPLDVLFNLDITG